MELSNRLLSLVFDDRSGELTSLRNSASGDEYLKRRPPGLGYQLAVTARAADGSFVTLLPPPPARVDATAVDDPGANGGTVRVRYEHLLGPAGPVPVAAEVRVQVAPDSGETVWSLAIDNGSDLILHEVLFPHLAGIVLGETHADDTLTYPYHAGERTRNPAVEYAGPQFFGDARNGVALQRVPTSAGHEGQTVYARECPYLGSASMAWMDLCDPQQGLYLASYDGTFLVTGLRVETGGPDSPWMGFSFRKHLAIRPGERWESRPYAVGVHGGDWHWGADRYREWAGRVFRPPATPRWLRDDPFVNPHYDFKSQTGRVTHRFRDIPAVHDTARAHGLNHLLFAGWSRLGFDGAYAEYFPDLDLGTQVELERACREVVGRGGKITFYINCRIFNVESDYRASVVEPAACRDSEGRLYLETYGTQTFAVMCPATASWRRISADFACWMVDVYHATGVYLDQVGSAPAVPCFATDHGHDHPGAFNQGYLTFLEDVRARVRASDPEAVLLIENCGDAYGQHVDGLLTWMPDADAGRRDHAWAVYKYAFPEHIQVNMVNPLEPLLQRRAAARGRGEPPDAAEETRLRAAYGGLSPEDYARQELYRAVLIGSHFWIRAESAPLSEDLQAVVGFRRAINGAVTAGRFRDTVGLSFDATAVEATAFWDAPGGGRDAQSAAQGVLVLAWNKSGLPQQLELDLEGRTVRSARSLVPGGSYVPFAEWDQGAPHPGDPASPSHSVRLRLPAAPLCAVELTAAPDV